MLEMSWITAILQLYSQVTYLFGNVILKPINIRLFDLLAPFHYILNLPRTESNFLWTKCLELTVTCSFFILLMISSWIK